MTGINCIEFDHSLFNKVFYEVDDAFNNENIRYFYLYGGSSSSKTYTLAQRFLIFTMEGRRNNCIIIKKIAEKIETTIFADFEELIEDWGLKDMFIVQKNYIECKETGSYITFSGLYDVDDLKGLKGYKKMLVDELDKITFADFKQLKKRLRGQKGQQYYFTFNPVSEFVFIKTEIFDREVLTELPCNSVDLKQINKKGDTLILRTNYLYNNWVVGDGKGGGFIDEHVIADFEKDKVNDINYYNIYALGLWGKLRTGGEFFKQFKDSIHVGDYKYNKKLPIHVVFDENVLPYLTCNIYQFDNGCLMQVDEIMLDDPFNTLKDTCNTFLNKYRDNQEGLFIYGDATSRKADTKIQKGQNFYLLVKTYLKDMKPTFRVPLANPSVVMSRRFVNDIFSSEIKGIDIKIDSSCRKSIFDYQYCTEDENGKVNKKITRNKETGQSYQEFGHCCDALRYIATVIFMDFYKKFQKG